MRLLFRILLANQILAALLTLGFALVVRPIHLGRLALTTFLLTNAVGGCVGLLFASLEWIQAYQGLPRLLQQVIRAGAVVVGTTLGMGAGLLVLHAIWPGGAFRWAEVLRVTGFAVLISAVMATLHILVGRLKAGIAAQAIEVQKLRELEAQARLTSLQGKVNPHFLFNTLNTMLSLVHTSPDTVEGLILRLSELYRTQLKLPDTGRIALSEELDLIRRYLEIEQIRLGGRLAFTVEAPLEAAAVCLPPLLVEPLVENAVKHGIGPRPEGGHVHLRAWVEGALLHVRVEDDGVGLRPGPGGGGFGLYSIRERLRLAYRGRGGLDLGTRPGGGFTAELRVPRD